jgi:hypothetical protein
MLSSPFHWVSFYSPIHGSTLPPIRTLAKLVQPIFHPVFSKFKYLNHVASIQSLETMKYGIVVNLLKPRKEIHSPLVGHLTDSSLLGHI